MKQLDYYFENEDLFLIKKHSTKDLYIISYKHTAIDWRNKFNRQARGIILDGDSKIVARPYEKFFNYKQFEGRRELPRDIKRMSEWEDEEFEVVEKVDGSMVTVSQYEDEMIYSSTGSIQGKYPHLFKMWFDRNLSPLQKRRLKEISRNYTLMFEYISPKERVVIKYGKEDMILHGIIHTESGDEILDSVRFEEIAKMIGVKTANRFNIGYDMIKRLQAREYDDNLIEGFVIIFKSGKRLKIKTDDYLRLHPLQTIFMGRVDTKNKIRTYIEMIDEGVIDDFVSMANERENEDAKNIINETIRLDEEFKELIRLAREITSRDGFSKKIYAVDVGTEKTLDRIVLNIEKDKAIDRIRENFIISELKGE